MRGLLLLAVAVVPLLSRSLVAQTQPERASPDAMAATPDPRERLREPSSCTVRTCMLALQEQAFSYVLTRGFPGKEIGRISVLRYPDFELAMASSPEALKALRGVRNSRVARNWTGPALALASFGASVVLDRQGVQPSSAVGLAVIGTALTGLGIELWGDATWMPRLQDAIRIYNLSLVNDLPE